MTITNLIGWITLSLIFVGLFAVGVKIMGLVEAICVFALAVVLAGLIVVAVFAICS